MNFSMYSKIFSAKKGILDDVEKMIKTEKDVHQQVSLAEKIVNDSFSDDEKIAIIYNSLSTTLTYLMYCFKENREDYPLLAKFLTHLYNREIILGQMA